MIDFAFCSVKSCFWNLSPLGPSSFLILTFTSHFWKFQSEHFMLREGKSIHLEEHEVVCLQEQIYWRIKKFPRFKGWVMLHVSITPDTRSWWNTTQLHIKTLVGSVHKIYKLNTSKSKSLNPLSYFSFWHTLSFFHLRTQAHHHRTFNYLLGQHYTS